jgi:hypothetical protein
MAPCRVPVDGIICTEGQVPLRSHNQKEGPGATTNANSRLKPKKRSIPFKWAIF